jgi:hypothetical protein
LNFTHLLNDKALRALRKISITPFILVWCKWTIINAQIFTLPDYIIFLSVFFSQPRRVCPHQNKTAKWAENRKMFALVFVALSHIFKIKKFYFVWVTLKNARKDDDRVMLVNAYVWRSARKYYEHDWLLWICVIASYVNCYFTITRVRWK